jgi:hypothetical protein
MPIAILNLLFSDIMTLKLAIKLGRKLLVIFVMLVMTALYISFDLLSA